MDEREKIEQTIRSLEAQRALLGNTVVETALAPLREKLAALQLVSEQQRKHVTILFADVSSFTASAEQMDAEDLNNIMNNLWAQLDRIVIEHGGRIDKHIGDALMALWGVEATKEDDVERAILAALAMQAAAEQMAKSINLPETGPLSPEQSALFKIRVGVHTGPVVLGKVGTQGEFTAMGDAVNIASRLEHAAPIGGVLVSHDTYRHVQGVFNVRKLPPLTLKGKSEPILAYLILSAKPRAFRIPLRGVEGIETHTIGQEEQLNTLLQNWGEVLSTRHMRMLTIIGDAGMGKSRLMDDLRNQMEFSSESFRFFEGRSTPQTRNIAYGLIRDIFENRFLIQDSDRSDTILRKLETGLQEFIQDQPIEKAHLMGALLGYDLTNSPLIGKILSDTQQIRERGLRAIQEFFSRVCQQRPAALFLDNIQWADQNSLELLQSLANVMQPLPFFVVCAARPSLFEFLPNWGESLPAHTQLILAPLDADKARQLVKDILRRVPEIPDALIETIVNRSDGNPYYIEELIKMLIDDGVIVPGSLEWHIETQKLTDLRIPQTLTGVIQARLDALPRPERDLLQKAAVVGRVFWESLLISMNAGQTTPDPAIQRQLLQALQARELIFQRKVSTFSHTSEYIFKNHILQEVTYQQVLKRQRRIYHEQIANWLIAQSGERADEYAALIAEHFEQAENLAHAAEWYKHAGQRAAVQFANQDALRLLQRALELFPANALQSRASCLLTRINIYDLLGKRTEQAADLETLGQLAEALGQDELRAEVCLLCAQYAQTVGNYTESQQLALRTLDLIQSAPPSRLNAQAHLLLGLIAMRQENMPKAQQEYQCALDLARRLQLPSLEAHSLRSLSNLLRFEQPATAQQYQEQANSIFETIGDLRGKVMTSLSLAVTLSIQNKIEAARARYQSSIQLCQQIGDVGTEMNLFNNLATVESQLGNYDQAIQSFEHSLAIARRIDSTYNIIITLGNLSSTYHQLGDYPKALAKAQEWLQYCQNMNDLRGVAWACNGAARLLIDLGQFEQAARLLQRSQHLFTENDNPNGLLETDILQMRLFWTAEDWPNAIQKAQEIFTNSNKLIQKTLLYWVHWMLGDAHRRQGNFQAALSAYHQAAQSPEQHFNSLLPHQAGLLLLYAQQGETDKAHRLLQESLPLLEHHDFELPQLWMMACCADALFALGDPRAVEMCARAQQTLQEKAALLNDPLLQDTYLNAIALHRRIRAGKFPLTGSIAQAQ